MTVSAAVKLIPRPPARVERRNTKMSVRACMVKNFVLSKKNNSINYKVAIVN